MENEGEVKLNLIQKLCALRLDLKNIEKSGRNKFQNYDYVEAGVLQGLVGNRLAEMNVAISKVQQKVSVGSHDKGGKLEHWALVECLYILTDGDDPKLPQHSFWSTGFGVDSGDKAIYKALTGCFKYFLVQAFCLAMGDDPEADEETDKRNAGKADGARKERQAKDVERPAGGTGGGGTADATGSARGVASAEEASRSKAPNADSSPAPPTPSEAQVAEFLEKCDKYSLHYDDIVDRWMRWGFNPEEELGAQAERVPLENHLKRVRWLNDQIEKAKQA